MQEVRIEADGQHLHGELHEATGRTRGGLLLVHGFNSSLEEFGQAPVWLAAAGYDVLAFDQRGFGRSTGEPGRTDVERAVADIQAAALHLRQESGRKVPLGVIGHSLGGAYTLAALSRGAPFAAAVVAQPVSRLFDEIGAVGRGFYHLLGRYTERREARGHAPGRIPYRSRSSRLFVSKEAQREAGRPDFLRRHVNLGNYRAAYTMSGVDWARSVEVPTLVVASPFDRTVKPASTMRIYDALREPKALLEHRGGHSCFRDLDGRFIVDGCIAWFDRHLGGKP